MKQAQQVKQLAEDRKFTNANLDKIFQGKELRAKDKPKPTINIKYKRKELVALGFIEADTTEKEVSDTVLKALEFYKQYNGKIKTVVIGEENLNNQISPPSAQKETITPVQEVPLIQPSIKVAPEPVKNEFSLFSAEQEANILAALDSF